MVMHGNKLSRLSLLSVVIEWGQVGSSMPSVCEIQICCCLLAQKFKLTKNSHYLFTFRVQLEALTFERETDIPSQIVT